MTHPEDDFNPHDYQNAGTEGYYANVSTRYQRICTWLIFSIGAACKLQTSSQGGARKALFSHQRLGHRRNNVRIIDLVRTY